MVLVVSHTFTRIANLGYIPGFFNRLKGKIMKIVYFSLTGNCKRFAEKLGFDTQPMKDASVSLSSDEDITLIFPTLGFGKVPSPVIRFLKQYKHNVKFVVSSGNRNWGANFAVGADTVTDKMDIPSYKIELAGTTEDVENVKQKIAEFM